MAGWHFLQQEEEEGVSLRKADADFLNYYFLSFFFNRLTIASI
jgi:hypothetical protein